MSSKNKNKLIYLPELLFMYRIKMYFFFQFNFPPFSSFIKLPSSFEIAQYVLPFSIHVKNETYV